MDSQTFSKYVPAIDAIFNPTVDSKCRSWSELVQIFFRFNDDATFRVAADLAETFVNAKHPTFFRINAESVESYFTKVRLSDANLCEMDFKANMDYIDEDGLRMSFNTLRRLVFTHSKDDELIQTFEFIDRVYQLYCRYCVEMAIAKKHPTHWTIVQVTKYGLTNTMKPHIDHAAIKAKADGKTIKDKFLLMDTQPDVYKIITGSLRDLQKKFLKYKTEHETKKSNKKGKAKPKYDYKMIMPIYEIVLPSVKDELETIIRFTNETYLTPFRKNQIQEAADDGAKLRITQTKINLKITQTMLLIDPTQEYSIEQFKSDVEEIRLNLQYGRTIHQTTPTRKKANETPVVKIGLFAKAKRIDEEQNIPLNPRTMNKISVFPEIDEATGDEAEESDDEEDEDNGNEEESDEEESDEEESDEEESDEEESDEEESDDEESDASMSEGENYSDSDNDSSSDFEEPQPSTPKGKGTKKRTAPSTSKSTKAQRAASSKKAAK